jgi:glycogen debranching enzyme
MDINIPTPDRQEIEQLAEKAKAMLAENRNELFTKPSASQYPHQWSWDAAFIAIGYSHYDQQLAEQEFRHLFSGQWKNGMIPHIVFSDSNDNDGNYFPGPDFWQTERSNKAPASPRTSGICQPPIHATALWLHLENAADKERAKEFASEMFPKLNDWHNYLKENRDLYNEGLLFIRHPWESGQDNSPTWDEPLERIDLSSIQLPEYRRKDLHHVDNEQRPTNQDYDHYIYLVDFFRQRNYDENKITDDDCPFMMQDVLFNTLYCKANRDMAKIAEEIGEDPEPFRKQADKTASAVDSKLWDEEHDMYIDYDLRSDKQIHAHILSGFIPLFAGIPDADRGQRMFDYLNTSCFCRLEDTCFAAPSYDRSGPGYSSSKYWRGPVWINMNWLLSIGLDKYGYHEYAEQIRNTIVNLPREEGFCEYYDPDTGKCYGTKKFSWTAALLLDVLYRYRL